MKSKIKPTFLRAYLTDEQVKELDKRLQTDEPLYNIYYSYNNALDAQGNLLLYEYIKKYRFPVPTKILGAKTTPYYQTEDDMLTPYYKWEDVPANEKALLQI
ncbi:MAG: hypothetical protein GTN59_10600, partial [Candidatus Dadabacteria bacterium]|nr:hypothetical protein [Candidatus Dadabacteria bacterium]